MNEHVANSIPPVTLSPGQTVTLSPCHAPVGLLAGSGRFPIAFAAKARQLGRPVVCVGVRDEAPVELMSLARRFYWTGLAQIGRAIRCFRQEGVRQVVMAGKIHKVRMHQPWRWLHFRPDWRTLRFWFNHARRDNKDDTLLLGLIAEFEADGIEIASALDLCPELLVKQGLLTRRALSAREALDVEFGWQLARDMGRLDIGQSVAVRERCVLAVEAIEGTDRAILRAGELCPRGGFVVVKVAKPQQDMRFDVPTVGAATIESLRRAGGRALAIEAGKTIVLDKDQVIALADRYGITLVACSEASTAGLRVSA
jgi:DUF1009 family protein